MKWKRRKLELARLRKKHPAVHAGCMPDLKTDSPRYPSLSETGVAKVQSSKKPAAPKLEVPDIFVGTPHKQGPMVMFREELAQGGGKKT